VSRVFAAELAMFVHFKPVRVVLFVLFGVVIALLALLASERNLHSSATCSHFIGTSLFFANQIHQNWQ